MARATAWAAAIWLLVGATCAGADTIYVDAGGGGDYTTIQAGINAASDGDEVVVASGTYPITSQITFGGRKIMLRAEYSQQAIIDCQGVTGGLYLDGAADSCYVLSFVIQNAYAGYGGGIYCGHGAKATVSDCLIRNCEAERGGALYCYQASLTVLSTTVTDCSATLWGGALYSYGSTLSLIGLVAGRNTAPEGGGLYLWGGTTTVQLSTFYRNSGATGGAIYAYSGNPMVLQTILSFSTSGKGIACGAGAAPYVGYSDIYGNAGGNDVCGTSLSNGNEDPRFCDMDEDDVTLCANSPCLPGGISLALIGARGEGCGDCASPVAPASWGALKALYR